jgi:hypothetical protein
MTKKDFTNNENIDHDKRAEQDWESHHTTGDRFPDEVKGIAETEVKNAHAAGDGALERNDKDLADKNDTGLFNNDLQDEQQRGHIDPPY